MPRAPGFPEESGARMTDPLWDTEAGQTPIDADAAAGLRPPWVSVRADLHQAESDNILEARGWRRS